MDTFVLSSLLLSLSINMFFFAFAWTFKTDKVTDLSYGLSFIAIAAFVAITNTADLNYLQWLIGGMVLAWGLRIAGYLLYRVIKTGRDNRFDKMRNSFLKFGRFWLLQAVSAWLIMLPASFLLSLNQPEASTIAIAAGFLVWMTGLATETLADIQLFRFRFSSKKSQPWIQSGVWKYSRHPNYFGEMLVWWGLFIIGLSLYDGWSWMTVAGPIAITVLLRFVSGVPILEKANDKRWKDKKGYDLYKEQTNLLLPIKIKS